MHPKKFEQERSVFNFEVVSTSYNFYESCFSNLNLSLTSIIKILRCNELLGRSYIVAFHSGII